MALTQPLFVTDELDPIDIVEHLAEFREWEFDRVGVDQIAMSVDGQWRTYSLTLAWSARDETLRLICTFEMEPPKRRLPALYEALNGANDLCWSGGFTYWADPKIMAYRYGLVLSDADPATAGQIDRMVATAVAACERFYPAFQLVCWGNRAPGDALQIAMAEAFGRA